MQRDTKEIVICDDCKGVGKRVVWINEGREQETKEKDCPTCNGNGRLMKKIIFEPLKKDEPYGFDIDVSFKNPFYNMGKFKIEPDI